MRRFILKSFIFTLPFLIGLSIELFVLPMDYFTFRAWEALVVRRFRNLLPGPFYPNMKMQKMEEGDLGHHTKFAIRRQVHWVTDRYGFRKENTSQHPEIVIVGDSNIAGGGVSQHEMLSEVLEKRLKVSVYPLAPARMETFLKMQRFKDHPPRIVILGAVERELIYLSPLKTKRSDKGDDKKKMFHFLKAFREERRFQSLVVLLDRIAKANMLHSLRANLRRAFASEMDLPHLCVVSKFGPMFFLQGPKANQEIPREKRDRVVEVIRGYHRALESRGIRFIFLPIPEKENLFHELLDTSKPGFLEQVITQLKKEGVETLNTQKAFEEAYQKEGLLLYQTDDSHWSQEGVRLASQLISEAIGEPK